MAKVPEYIAIRIVSGKPTPIHWFYDSFSMDEFSKLTNDKTIFIYKLGTDFLKDGHTEGSR